jgi:hypothetical protein
MKIILSIRGDMYHDITPLLDENAKIILTQELERDAFERTVEDLSLRASNIDGLFSDIFRNGTASTRFSVIVSEESRTLFHGEVDNESIRFDARELWVEMNVFSMNHRFWDRAKSTRVMLSFTTEEQAKLTVSVKELLTRELGPDRVETGNRPLFYDDMFSSFSIAAEYENRQIRFYTDTDDSQIGNNGKYANLASSTTVYDLLTAMSVYYNAEFFINPETEALTMRRRLSANPVIYDINDRILDDAKIEVLFLDRNKYDYIYTMFAVTEAPVPVFDRFGSNTAGTEFLLHVNPSGKEKIFKYFLTCFINDVESAPSGPLMIAVPPTKIWTDDLGTAHVQASDVVLTIPEGYPGTEKRFLYRTEALPVGSSSIQLEGPEIDVVSVAVGNPALITTSIPHNLAAEDTVKFSDTGSIPNLSGSYPVKEIKSNKTFTVECTVVSEGKRGTVRKIYGPAVVDFPNVYLLAVIDGNSPVSYRDGTDHSPRCNTSVVMPKAAPVAVSAWIGYDESVQPNRWKEPILDVESGDNTPVGNIFDVVPKLNFVSSNVPGLVNEYNLYDVFCFFTKDIDLSTLTSRWENLLKTIRGVSCRVKGINFRVGDEIVLSSGLPFGDTLDLRPRMIVKKAAIDLVKEETDLELISL